MAIEDEAEEIISDLNNIVKVLQELVQQNYRQHKALFDMYYLYKGVEGLDRDKILEEVHSLTRDNENRN